MEQVDMEKLADGLQKLTEDDLLNVVQLIHDHKTSDTYTKNDVESRLIYESVTTRHLTNYVVRWRIPRRPLYPTRQPRQNAVGSMHREGCVIEWLS